MPSELHPTPLEISYGLSLADDELAEGIERLGRMMPPVDHEIEAYLHQARRDIARARKLLERAIGR